MYRPRDIADMKVKNWGDTLNMHLSGKAAPGAAAGGTVGSPVLEVFLRQAAAAAGATMEVGTPKRLSHQAVSLKVPSMQEVEAKRIGSSGAPIIPEVRGVITSVQLAGANLIPGTALISTPSSVVRLSVSIGQDGTASIKGLPPQPDASFMPLTLTPVVPKIVPRSQFSAGEAAEVEATMRALRGDRSSIKAPPPVPPPSPAAGKLGDLDALVLGEVSRGLQEQLAVLQDLKEAKEELQVTLSELKDAQKVEQDELDVTQAELEVLEANKELVVAEAELAALSGVAFDEEIDITAAMSSIDGEDTLGGMGSSLVSEVLADGEEAFADVQAGVGSLAAALAEEGAFAELTRLPAQVEMLGRDMFVFRVPDDPPASSSFTGGPAAGGRGSSESSAHGGSATLGKVSPAAVAISTSSEQLQHAGPSGSTASSSSSSNTRESSRLRFVYPSAASSSAAAAEDASESFEVEIPVGRLMLQRAPASALADTFDELAERVAERQVSHVSIHSQGNMSMGP